MSTAEPRRTPLADAAGSYVGLNPVTRATKVRDVFIVVVLPFVIPALVLPMANGAASFTLTNLAFGFVGVAVAGVARAVTSRAEEWLAYVLVALTCVALQTALAVVDDTSEASAALKTVVLHDTDSPVRASLAQMRTSAIAVTHAQPSPFHWICCSVLGVALMVVSFELIRREQ